MEKPILLVDDSEDTRELFSAALRAEGFSVVTADNGLSALRILEERSNIALVLLDLSMPQMSGLEMLQEMEQRGLNTMPVILVSGQANLGSLKVPGNVVDTLKKPFFYPELIYKIKKLPSLSPWPAQ